MHYLTSYTYSNETDPETGKVEANVPLEPIQTSCAALITVSGTTMSLSGSVSRQAVSPYRTLVGGLLEATLVSDDVARPFGLCGSYHLKETHCKRPSRESEFSNSHLLHSHVEFNGAQQRSLKLLLLA